MVCYWTFDKATNGWSEVGRWHDPLTRRLNPCNIVLSERIRYFHSQASLLRDCLLWRYPHILLWLWSLMILTNQSTGTSTRSTGSLHWGPRSDLKVSMRYCSQFTEKARTPSNPHIPLDWYHCYLVTAFTATLCTTVLTCHYGPHHHSSIGHIHQRQNIFPKFWIRCTTWYNVGTVNDDGHDEEDTPSPYNSQRYWHSVCS